jgi:hypothetical protein
MKSRTIAIIGIVSILVILSIFKVYKHTIKAPADQVGAQATSTLQQYSSVEYGITFSYPESYALSEIDTPGSGMRKHHVITLMRKADLPPPVNGEGPPAITIEMYQNDLEKQTTEEWIRNTSASNFKLGEGKLTEIMVAGLPALSYRWSGLYEGTTIALAQQKWVYVLTVTYLEMGADIIQDFVAIRDSVRINN